MVNMEALIKRQEANFVTLNSYLDTLRKGTKLSTTALKLRLEGLEKIWSRCTTLHQDLLEIATDPRDTEHRYFTEDSYNKACEVYLANIDLLGQLLSDHEEAAVAASPVSTGSAVRSNQSVRLPRIDVPKFSGEYTEWTNFRDLFQALVDENEQLPAVEKFHYLKTCLTGEANLFFRHLAVTEANYLSAWDLLKSRYENTRLIIHSHLSAFHDLPAMTSESCSDLKVLRDGTANMIASLKSLGRPVDQCDDFIVFSITRKFDKSTRMAWESHLGQSTDPPSYATLREFLDTRVRVLESIKFTHVPPSRQINNIRQRGPPIRAHLATTARSTCAMCNANHFLHQCDKFKMMDVAKRQSKVRELRCCFNCLRQGHVPKDCPTKSSCFVCRKRHHTLIHADPTSQPKSTQFSNAASQSTLSDDANSSSTTTHLVRSSNWTTSPVLLATARVIVKNEHGKSIEVRALIDQGSEMTFVTESLAQFLKPPRQRVNVSVAVVSEQIASVARSSVKLKVQPRNRAEPTIAFTALVLPKLSAYRPAQPLRVADWTPLRRLELADPTPLSTDPFDILFGADMYGTFLKDGVINGYPGVPLAQDTIFGWILSGPSGASGQNPRIITAHNTALIELENSLRQFWEIEETPRDVHLTHEEEQCESHFIATHSRTPNGRYVVRLPFKTDLDKLKIGNSITVAENMMLRMERRLARDGNLYNEYRAFMRDYSSQGHMRKMHGPLNLPNPSRTFFIPHHPVVRESSSTTRVRVVFNASCRTSNGVSLNDLLLIGPKLQQDLALILMQWRMHKYVFTADIQQMYRQILIHPRDTAYQCILWRDQPTDPMCAYELLTVTYGTACAPYLALRVLQKLAEDEGTSFPLGKSAIETEIYVDDILSGAQTLSEALNKRDQVRDLLSRGHFKLRKWSANHTDLLSDLPADDCSTEKDRPLSDEHALKILGLTWEPSADQFRFSNLDIEPLRPTKRNVLSIIARLFDPLGWLAPIVISAKILMQELWIRGIDWDSELPNDLRVHWQDYCANLKKLRNVSVPRWTGFTGQHIAVELHGFADASRRAYAAVIYLRVIQNDLKADVRLIASKTKVAPIKELSIPRLELCAISLLARLMSKVRNHLQLKTVATHAWTDSTIVLAWLSRHPSTWKTFVANRVSDFQTRLPNCSVRHVPTKENPADCASRGMSVIELEHHELWWKGPSWLALPSTNWPSSAQPAPLESLEQEKRTNISVNTLTLSSAAICREDDFSSWARLLRVTAYVLKFCALLRRHQARENSAAISGTYVHQARIYWLRYAQTCAFSRDVTAIKNGKPAEAPALQKLCPFLDKDGLLRVGGRLSQSALSFDEKHPVILPKHRVSELIISHAHIRCLHGGTQLTLRVVRQNYWILGARTTIKAIIHRCLPCVRERKVSPTQIMADLPKSRITPSRPFAHCGVDYAGPILVRASRLRNSTAIKTYIAVFICFATRAAHLELVSDCTSEAFLAALRRFISRRGLPDTVYSDNGTTFQGADRELRQSFRRLMKDDNLASVIASDGIRWSYIPPAAPHFGGLWEAGVKSVKHHLKRVVGSHAMTYEELATLLCQIEASLNSRPIAPMSDDPASFAPLTPGHFLIGSPLTALPEPSLLNVTENRLNKYQLIQRLHQQFWKRWSIDYLNTLQQRRRWFRERPDLEVGELVLLRNDNLPPSKWQLGRILECHRGRDNHTRVVTIKTSASVLKRPISQVCVLPVRTTNSAEI